LKLMAKRLYWLIDLPSTVILRGQEQNNPCLGPLPRSTDPRMPHYPAGGSTRGGGRWNHASIQPIPSPLLQFGRYSAQPSTSPKFLSADFGS
jgi:hypothetical protein